MNERRRPRKMTQKPMITEAFHMQTFWIYASR